MVKLGNPKNAFWEALLLAIVVFVFGIFLGIGFESSRTNKINEYYAKSEIFLMDFLALNNIDNLNLECEKLITSNVEFADRIYDEAFLLEKYEDAGKISDNIKLAHKKYDIARTLLWTNVIRVKEKCENFSYVVYLYEYETKDLFQKAEQKVWSRILFDLKQKKGNEIILIPIAVDSNLSSLNSLVSRFNISRFPVVIIDDEHIIEELNSVEGLERYLR